MLISNNEIRPHNLNTDPIKTPTKRPKHSEAILAFPTKKISEISETSYSIENNYNVKTTTKSDPAQANIVEPTRFTSKTPIDIRGKGF